jgi:hypothetical protein
MARLFTGVHTMGLIRLALAGAAGYAFYKYATRDATEQKAALATGESAPTGSFTQVRNAGPDAMADKPGDWHKIDQASDESFPASDPPSTY